MGVVVVLSAWVGGVGWGGVGWGGVGGWVVVGERGRRRRREGGRRGEEGGGVVEEGGGVVEVVTRTWSLTEDLCR